MKDEKSLEVFSSMPVGQAVFKNAVPSIVAMLMVLVFTILQTRFLLEERMILIRWLLYHWHLRHLLSILLWEQFLGLAVLLLFHVYWELAE